jgi:hypothetical protein
MAQCQGIYSREDVSNSIANAGFCRLTGVVVSFLGNGTLPVAAFYTATQ